MKLKELVDGENENYDSTSLILLKYLEKDCVIAYNKNKTSVVCLIKTAKTYVGFYCITR